MPAWMRSCSSCRAPPHRTTRSSPRSVSLPKRCGHGSSGLKSDHKRLAHQDCHPEPFGFAQDKLREGSRSQILRCAQNDKVEWWRGEVYECHVVRFRLSQTRAVEWYSHISQSKGGHSMDF